MARFRGQSGSQGWRKSSSTGAGGSAPEVQAPDGSGNYTFTTATTELIAKATTGTTASTVTINDHGVVKKTLTIDNSANADACMVTLPSGDLVQAQVHQIGEVKLYWNGSAWKLTDPGPLLDLEKQLTAGDGTGDVTFVTQAKQYLAVLATGDGMANITLPNALIARTALIVINGNINLPGIAAASTLGPWTIPVVEGGSYSQTDFYFIVEQSSWVPSSLAAVEIAAQVDITAAAGTFAIDGTSGAPSIAGVPLPLIVANVEATAPETATQTNWLTWTPDQNRLFLISGYINVSAYTSGTLTTTVTFKDAAGTSHTITLELCNSTLVSSPSGTGFFAFYPIVIQANSTAAIDVTTTLSGGGAATFILGGLIEQLS